MQTMTNLTSTNWVPAVPQPTVLGTNNVVTNTASGTEALYRLIPP